LGAGNLHGVHHRGRDEHRQIAAARALNERIERLCPQLKSILDAELRAGNAVAQTWDDRGFGVLLKKPFLLEHHRDSSVAFRRLDDPHYWKAEYSSQDQILACAF
jgi:hypothetical protein